MTLTQIKSAGLSKPINLADDEKILLGSSNDFEIFHQSSNGNSIIRETGGGNLSLQTNGANINFYDSANSGNLASFVTGGATNLFYNGSKTFETTSTGIKVNPVVTIDGSTPRLQMKPTADSQSHRIEFFNTADSIVSRIYGLPSGDLSLQTGGTGGNETSVKCIANGAVQLFNNNSKKFETTSYGAEFFGDLGVNRITGGYTFRTVAGGDERAGVHSDASNDLIFKAGAASEAARFSSSTLRFGIGTTSPAAPLHIQKSGTSQNLLTLESDLGTNNNRTLIIGGPTSDSGSAPFRFTTGNSLQFRIDSTDALTIADNARIGIGTTNPSSILTTEQSTGNINLELHATGSGRGSQVKCHNDHGTAYLGLAGNTNGELLIYQETNAPTLFHTNGQERMRIDSSGNLGINNTSPTHKLDIDNGTAKINRGNSTGDILILRGLNADQFRFDTDGLKFGTDTASANALDDYEEGTFTPTSNNDLGAAEGSYTKIGRQVTLHIRVTVDSNTNNNAMVIGGFPFTPSMPSGLSNGSTPAGFGYISGSVITGGIQIHTRYNVNECQFYTFTTNLKRSHFSGRELRFGLVYHV